MKTAIIRTIALALGTSLVALTAGCSEESSLDTTQAALSGDDGDDGDDAAGSEPGKPARLKDDCDAPPGVQPKRTKPGVGPGSAAPEKEGEGEAAVN